MALYSPMRIALTYLQQVTKEGNYKYSLVVICDILCRSITRIIYLQPCCPRFLLGWPQHIGKCFGLHVGPTRHGTLRRSVIWCSPIRRWHHQLLFMLHALPCLVSEVWMPTPWCSPGYFDHDVSHSPLSWVSHQGYLGSTKHEGPGGTSVVFFFFFFFFFWGGGRSQKRNTSLIAPMMFRNWRAASWCYEQIEFVYAMHRLSLWGLQGIYCALRLESSFTTHRDEIADACSVIMFVLW